MTNRELKNRLKALRTIKSAAMPNALWMSETRNLLLANAKSQAVPVGQNQLIAPIVLPHTVGSRVMFALRPVMAVFMVIGFGVVGWAAGVASFGNKPNAPFYGLKTAAELTRLTFAVDPSSRAYLHLELAGRRANEVAVLAESDDVNRESEMNAAMVELQKEIASVGSNLDEVSATKADDTAAVAKAVDRKVAEIRAVFSKTKHLLGSAAQTKATEVEAAADDVSLKAVAVLVASAKNTGDKSDAATRVKEKIDAAKSNLEVASTEASAQAQAVLKEAQAAFDSDNLAEAVIKVQDAADITNAIEPVEAKPPQVAPGATPEASPLINTNTNVPTGKIKAIGF